ncbi:hypothetical protein [Sphingobacterium sp. LRF_L2]|uniref:hypothetical protein n=1 Tax=Sphingobacterium sp. LRF_L2 TaxID=3369421 RepID=UPI003F61B327
MDTSIRILGALADHGYLVSQKRQVIVAYLCRLRSIENVDEFWLGIRKEHAVSWATVRNTIRLLIEIGYLVPKQGNSNYQGFDLCFPVAN